MKKLAALIAFSVFTVLCGGELIFVPGWLSKNRPESDYTDMLTQIYPDREIKIWYWESNTTFGEAILRTRDAAVDVAGYIAGKDEKDRKNIILAGHSLGAKVVLETVKILSAKNIRIDYIILLGAAIDFEESFDTVGRATRGKNINLFSRKDIVLKHLFNLNRQNLAIGFCGIEKAPERMVQYSVECNIPDCYKNNLYSETVQSHLAKNYLAELQKVVRKEIAPYKTQYDYSQVTVIPGAFILPGDIVVPDFSAVSVIDSYAGWTLNSLICEKTIGLGRFSKKINCKIYFIKDHYDRFIKWNMVDIVLKDEFELIKKQIRPLN